MTERIVIENCAIATVDGQDTEHATGHVVVAGNLIEAVGAGPAPDGLRDVARRVDGTGHLATPGLVNTHHHFYQWITRGLAQDSNLFNWLVELYPASCIARVTECPAFNFWRNPRMRHEFAYSFGVIPSTALNVR